MKKYIAIFFLFFYSVTTVGAAAHFHYCNEQLLNVSFSSSSKDNNGCGDTHSHSIKDNCKEKHGNIEQGEDQTIASNTKYHYRAFSTIATLPNVSSYNASVPFNVTVSYPSGNAPPVVHKLRLHVLNRVFLI